MGDFLMPSLGADMEAGTLVEWKVKPGDSVKRGDIVAVVETDKGAIDMEIWESGVVEEVLVAPGTRVGVGTVLARVRGIGGAPTEGAAVAPARPAAAMPTPAPSPTKAPVQPSEVGRPVSVRASPVARKLAKELGVDLAQVPGTGPGGAVTHQDVTAFASARTTAPAPAPAQASAPFADRTAAMRRAIAAAMARSKREIPHYYLGSHVDMGRALAWLRERNQSRSVGERILPVALLLKAVALAARAVPQLNGFWQDDGFRPAEAVHVGCAISLREGGLVAPALHDVDHKDLDQLMREFNDLVSRARSGHLRSSELADGTLTVTSLGDRGAESVLGVIFPPQVALVGFGRVIEEPAALDGRIELRPRIAASLSADHRASDGHRGGIFLEKLERLLQRPEEL
ncbi:MAG: 2-oxo acid dehydrogenase subunit E2 [Deltaproteobacteria bacterium]|nr:2-oxo acid dehydrogenase subunit E2 [Deltaproteobacteria bacterium]